MIWTIVLERNKDVAYEIGKVKGGQNIGGSGCRNRRAEANAKRNRKKNLDFIVLNDLTKQEQ